jgi:hypothetical protein
MKFVEIVQHLIDGGAARRTVWQDDSEVCLDPNTGFMLITKNTSAKELRPLYSHNIKADDWVIIPNYMTWGEAYKVLSEGGTVNRQGLTPITFNFAGDLVYTYTGAPATLSKAAFESNKWLALHPTKYHEGGSHMGVKK